VALERPPLPHIVGRYALYGEIAAGGMATVHYGRLTGPVGFSRTVAIKRLHAQFAKNPDFVSMFLDEARLAARIRHPNVVQTLDVVALEGELFLVMDYVQGESLHRLLRAARTKKQPIAPAIASAIVCGALHGLHAAHEATSEQGEPLGIVHRDVSPQNVLVGADGIPRVLDFGVAKAEGRITTTRDGQVKGKLAYMAPEQLRRGTIDRRTDVFAAGIVLWESLTLRRLFHGDSEGNVVTSVLEERIVPPSAIAGGLPEGLDDVVLRALDRDQSKRFGTAREMALALEAVVPFASPTRVGEWVEGLVGDLLASRAKSVARIESDSNSGQLLPPPLPAAPAENAAGANASQVSSISVTSSGAHHVTRGWRRPWVGAAIGGGAVVIALAVVGAVRAGRSSAGPAASTPPVAVQASIAPPPTSASTEAPQASASVAPRPTASSAPTQVAGPKPVKPPAGRVATPAKPCVIKSYIDESGIKHFVEECK
jgi:serine/threonine protein kinase